MFYNDSYRSIHGIPRYCSVRQYQVEANVDTFDALVRKLLFRFMNRCHRSTNVFVHSLLHSCRFCCSKYVARQRFEDTRLEAKAKAKDTKKSEAKDSLSEDRHSRGQGQECSRPRPRTKDTKRKCSPKKKKKRSSQKFFKRSPLKNVFQKIFQALHKILTFQKIVLSSSRGQANFRGLEASRPRPRT